MLIFTTSFWPKNFCTKTFWPKHFGWQTFGWEQTEICLLVNWQLTKWKDHKCADETLCLLDKRRLLDVWSPKCMLAKMFFDQKVGNQILKKNADALDN